MTNFTTDELNVLFDAVETWEKEDLGPGLIGAMLGGMLGKDDPEAQEKYKIQMKDQQKEADDKKRERKELGCVLKAKIVSLKKVEA